MDYESEAARLVPPEDLSGTMGGYAIVINHVAAALRQAHANGLREAGRLIQNVTHNLGAGVNPNPRLYHHVIIERAEKIERNE